ncbi:uncharacterized protein [Panulirus ornatus]|uniref:uncharacterized protein isoform X2 n=1 Tax=Panulirus ornatus TaxID=150431 RepID=UPI003A8BD6EC
MCRNCRVIEVRKMVQLRPLTPVRMLPRSNISSTETVTRTLRAVCTNVTVTLGSGGDGYVIRHPPVTHARGRTTHRQPHFTCRSRGGRTPALGVGRLPNPRFEPTWGRPRAALKFVAVSSVDLYATNAGCDLINQETIQEEVFSDRTKLRG